MKGLRSEYLVLMLIQNILVRTTQLDIPILVGLLLLNFSDKND